MLITKNWYVLFNSKMRKKEKEIEKIEKREQCDGSGGAKQLNEELLRP